MGMRVVLMTLMTVVVTCVATPSGLGQECGDNPMKEILNVAKRTGSSLNGVLVLLRDIDTAAYESLSSQFRQYAACVGLLDTGYFRKRSSPWNGHKMAPVHGHKMAPVSSHKMAPVSRTLNTRDMDAERYLELRWLQALAGLNEPRRLEDEEDVLVTVY